MAEDKKDSFWDNKNDDFWSKPVVSDDWLKSNNDSFWNSDTVEEKPDISGSANGNIQTQDRSGQTVQWQKQRDVKRVEDNPYVQHVTPEQVQDILEGRKPGKNARTKSFQKQSEAKTGKKHIHTKICLCAIALTVLAVFALVGASRWKMNSAIRTVSVFRGTEEKAGNSIKLTEADVMLLEDLAYTVVSETEDEFVHDKVKVIAVYAGIDRDEDVHIKASTEILPLNPYIGYDTEQGREYRSAGNSWEIETYGIESAGFTKKHFIYSYVYKGYDSVGFYFFTVPVDVTEIDFYVETYSDDNIFRIVDKTYVKNMQIEDQPDLEELLSRKVVQ